MYEWSVILFFFIVPIIAIIFEISLLNTKTSFVDIALKWFVFSGIGLRLGSAGIKQILLPSFTAKEIFNIVDKKSFVIVRELGFSNVCFALIFFCLYILIHLEFRPPLREDYILD